MARPKRGAEKKREPEKKRDPEKASGRVRVIAGEFRGRRLLVPPGEDVRPTKDMVREAVFSALDARGAIVDATVLDLFSGTGALAIEALSRGSSKALLVERDRTALDAIAHNLEQLDLGARTRVERADAFGFLAGRLPREAPFGLVFADPPYGTTDDEVATILAGLAGAGWLAVDAMIAVERPVGAQLNPPEGFRACWERTFGDTLVFFVDASDAPI